MCFSCSIPFDYTLGTIFVAEKCGDVYRVYVMVDKMWETLTANFKIKSTLFIMHVCL